MLEDTNPEARPAASDAQRVAKESEVGLGRISQSKTVSRLLHPHSDAKKDGGEGVGEVQQDNGLSYEYFVLDTFPCSAATEDSPVFCVDDLALSFDKFEEKQCRRLLRQFERIIDNPEAHLSDDIWKYANELEKHGLLEQAAELKTVIVERPPVTPRRHYATEHHGKTKYDPYNWLGDPRYREDMITGLREENAYAAAALERLKPLQRDIIDEALSRMPRVTENLLGRIGDYVYYEVKKRDMQHPIVMRAHASCVQVDDQGDVEWDGSAENEPEDPKMEVVIDYNSYIERTCFYEADEAAVDLRNKIHEARQMNFGSFDVSADNKIMLFQYATRGNEKYCIVVKNLETGEESEWQPEDVSDGAVITPDGSTIYYVEELTDKKQSRVYAHTPFSDPEQDLPIYTEHDPAYGVSIEKSSDGEFLFIYSESLEVSEVRFIRLNDPEKKVHLFVSRKEKLLCEVIPYEDRFFIKTNIDECHNKCIMTVSSQAPGIENWEEYVEEEETRWIKGIEIVCDHLVLTYGLNNRREDVEDVDLGEDGDQEESWIATEIYTYNLKTDEESMIQYPDDLEEEVAYSYSVDPVFDRKNTRHIYLNYSSRVTPDRMYAYDTRTGIIGLTYEDEYIGYDRDQYELKTVSVESHDGEKIPMHLLAPVGVDQPIPYLLLAYGMYGDELSMAFDDWPKNFQHFSLSLLERGCGIAFACVRGGGDLGPEHYEGGVRENLHNGIEDGVACVDYLVEKGLTEPSKLGITGRSAGGAWAAGVINKASEYIQVGIVKVPAVDALTSLLDPDEPGTPCHWDIWGNPITSKKDYERLKKWSPYENIMRQEHPAMLITAGLDDQRVLAHGPYKYASKVRDMDVRSDNEILFCTNMGAGHFGSPGNIDNIAEMALEAAFFLDHVGVWEATREETLRSDEADEAERFSRAILNPYRPLDSEPS